MKKYAIPHALNIITIDMIKIDKNATNDFLNFSRFNSEDLFPAISSIRVENVLFLFKSRHENKYMKNIAHIKKVLLTITIINSPLFTFVYLSLNIIK